MAQAEALARELAGLRHTVEEINKPGFQRVLGAYDEEPISLDELLENLRSVSQMVCGDADVGPDSVPHQSLRVTPELCSKERFHGWAHAVDDGTQIPGLVSCRPLKLFQGGQNSAAVRVTQNYHEPSVEPCRGELDATDLRSSDDVPGNADNKQVAQALVEHDLCRHPRVGTTENDGERLLTCRQFAAACLARACVGASNVRYETTVTLAQAFECFWR